MTDTQQSFLDTLRACSARRMLSDVEEEFVRDLHEDDELTDHHAGMLSNLWARCLMRVVAPGVIPDVDVFQDSEGVGPETATIVEADDEGGNM